MPTMCTSNPCSNYTHLLNRACNRTMKLGELHHPVTSLIYIVTAALCIAISGVTHLKYNSVTALNLTLRTKSISNTVWIFYFSVIGCRTLLGGIIYGIAADRDPHPVRLKVYFIADAVLKSMEVLLLTLALHHQQKYRSRGFLQEEISRFNSRELSLQEQSLMSMMTTMLMKVETYVGTLFIFSMVFLTVQEIPKSQSEPFYWLYLAFLWLQCIFALVFLCLIVYERNEDGPQWLLKVLLVVGVFLSLPGDIPSYVWSSCISCNCDKFKNLFTCYDLAIFLSIPSSIIFFIALRLEFLRLYQEAQYSAVGEVESLFSVHSQSL